MTSTLASAAESGTPSKRKSRALGLVWTEEHQTAFDNCIRVLKSAVIVNVIDIDQPLTIYVDASDSGYGAVLLQPSATNGPLHIVGLVSKKFSKEQMSYSVHRKEAFALAQVVLKFWPFVRGATIFSDHRALQALCEEDAPRSISGWAQTVAASGATVHFISGDANNFADWLSRLHEDSSEKRILPIQLLEEANAAAFANGPLVCRTMALQQADIDATSRRIQQSLGREERLLSPGERESPTRWHSLTAASRPTNRRFIPRIRLEGPRSPIPSVYGIIKHCIR